MPPPGGLDHDRKPEIGVADNDDFEVAATGSQEWPPGVVQERPGPHLALAEWMEVDTADAGKGRAQDAREIGIVDRDIDVQRAVSGAALICETRCRYRNPRIRRVVWSGTDHDCRAAHGGNPQRLARGRVAAQNQSACLARLRHAGGQRIDLEAGDGALADQRTGATTAGGAQTAHDGMARSPASPALTPGVCEYDVQDPGRHKQGDDRHEVLREREPGTLVPGRRESARK